MSYSVINIMQNSFEPIIVIKLFCFAFFSPPLLVVIVKELNPACTCVFLHINKEVHLAKIHLANIQVISVCTSLLFYLPAGEAFTLQSDTK